MAPGRPGPESTGPVRPEAEPPGLVQQVGAAWQAATQRTATLVPLAVLLARPKAPARSTTPVAASGRGPAEPTAKALPALRPRFRSRIGSGGSQGPSGSPSAMLVRSPRHGRNVD